jgi:ribosomal protein S27AE
MRKKQDRTEYNKQYREANRERLKLYARDFRKSGRATRDLKKLDQSVKSWIQRHPERRKAHRVVFVAVRNGSLKKEPCEVCGSTTVQAHHEDYSKPLEVMWLCRIHHWERDRPRIEKEKSAS